MDPPNKRPLVVTGAGDELQVPEGTAAVEAAAHGPGDDIGQRVAGGGETDVLAEVDGARCSPLRNGLEAEALLTAGDAVEVGGNVGPDLLERRGPVTVVDHDDLARVPGDGGRLEAEDGEVLGGQRVHRAYTGSIWSAICADT